MPANLWLKSIVDRNNEKYGDLMEKFQLEKVQVSQSSKEHKKILSKINSLYKKIMSDDAYFMDQYGQTSLLERLGLDWKRDVGALLVDDEIPADSARILADKINDAEIKEIDQTFLNGVEGNQEEWQKFFEDKRKNLIGLLEKSIKLDESLKCSI